MFCKNKLLVIIAVLSVFFTGNSNNLIYSQEIKFNLTPGYVVPLSNRSNDYSYGLFLQGKVTYPVSELTDLHLTAIYQYDSYKDNICILDQDVQYLIFGVGSKVILLKDILKPYAGIDINLGYTYFSAKNTVNNSLSNSNDGPAFIVSPNIGFLYPISSKLQIEPNIKIIYEIGDTEINSLLLGVGITY